MRSVHLAAILLVACADGTAPPTEPLARQDAAAAVALASELTPPTVFNVVLRAENEPFGASTSEAKGTAKASVLQDGSIAFTFTINNKGGEVFNRAHIHKAPAGANGPIHWDFLEAGVPVATVEGQPAQLRGLAVPRADADLADLLANPDQYYVNV
ncbi:MAG: CHRD domain-containing protein, partial [Gemmatimonadales bacterium]